MAKKLPIKPAATFDLTKGRILHDNVLVKPIRLEKNGTLVDPQQYEDKPEFGEVLACGPGRIYDNGEVVPLTVKVGDIVFFQKYSAQKVRIAGVDHLLIHEEDVYWVK